MAETEAKKETIKKAHKVLDRIERIVDNNYTTMKLAENRSLTKTVDENIDIHNCAIVRAYVRPNDYNTHMDEKKARKYCEEILSISTSRNATSLTDMRQARESDAKDHNMYPDNTRVIQTGGTKSRGYPVFELEHKIPCFDN